MKGRENGRVGREIVEAEMKGTTRIDQQVPPVGVLQHSAGMNWHFFDLALRDRIISRARCTATGEDSTHQ